MNENKCNATYVENSKGKSKSTYKQVFVTNNIDTLKNEISHSLELTPSNNR